MDNDTHGERCWGGVGWAVDWGRGGGELQKRKMIKIAEEKRKTGASLQQRDERRMQ